MPPSAFYPLLLELKASRRRVNGHLVGLPRPRWPWLTPISKEGPCCPVRQCGDTWEHPSCHAEESVLPATALSPLPLSLSCAVVCHLSGDEPAEAGTTQPRADPSVWVGGLVLAVLSAMRDDTALRFLWGG